MNLKADFLNFFALLPFLTLLQSLIFAVLLVTRGIRQERHSDFWLAALLLSLGLSGVPYMFGWLGIMTLWEKYTFLPWDSAGYLTIPCCYMFLKNLVNEEWRFKWSDSVYFSIFILYFVYHTVIGLMGHDYALWWWQNIDNNYFINYIFNVADMCLQVYLFVKMLQIYNAYREWIKSYFSDTERISFVWFRNFLVIYFLNFIANFMMIIYVAVTQYDYEGMWWGYFLTMVFVYYLSIFGYSQTQNRSVRFIQKEDNKAEEIVSIEKEENVALRDLDIDFWKNKVLHYFEHEKPYLNPELKLSDVSLQLKTNLNTMSAVINSGFAKNFNDFVNEYRISEFKTQSQSKDNQHLTLLAIAFDCGFNSKTTFNRAFKKEVGTAPKEWISTT
jgi:AraC-like DNA-binding protein